MAHGSKSSNSAYNEFATRDNLPWPNCDSDGKADNKQQAFINTDTPDFLKFRQATLDTPPPHPRQGLYRVWVTVINGRKTFALTLRFRQVSQGRRPKHIIGSEVSPNEADNIHVHVPATCVIAIVVLCPANTIPALG